jgi:2-phospho-L-lactate guanylyltransferase (CobY/MobA/RfbA family)
MGDLPDIEPDDVEALLDALDSANVVLAPDLAGLGTSALGLRPIDAIPVSFGGGRSLASHRRAASERDLVTLELDRPGLAHDLDTLGDVGPRPGLAGPRQGC